MAQLTDKLSRRTFVKGAAAAGALAGIAALGGCASEQKTEDKSEAKTDAPESKYDNTISADTEDLNIVLLGKDSKIAAIILALKKGYYEEEKLNVATQTVSGGFPEAMPALSNGTADVLPFGSIPSCTYIAMTWSSSAAPSPMAPSASRSSRTRTPTRSPRISKGRRSAASAWRPAT